MMNNSQNIIIDLSFNEIFYEFRITETIDLLNDDEIKKRTNDDNSSISVKKKKEILRKKTANAINFDQTMQKLKYDVRHKCFDFEKNAKVYIRLHKGYFQPDLKNRKFNKQKINPIEIVEKIEKLTYRFDISKTWKIHSIISMIHLKSASEKKNSYNKKHIEFESVKTNGNENDFNLYEVEKIIAKKNRQTDRKRHRRTHIEFRVKWLG